MKQRRFQSDFGFTLIEMMISMVIASFVVLYIGQTYSDTSQKYIHNREVFQTQTRAQVSSDYISNELRNAGYIMGWDAAPDAPPIAVNQAITGATVAPGTESLTVRYAQGPLTGVGAPVAVIDMPPGGAPLGVAALIVKPLTFAITNGTLVAIYSPPATVNVRRVNATSNVGGTVITFATPTTIAFPDKSMVAIIQESSFWIDQASGSLWMRTASVLGQAPTNQQLASNVEDLQVALINKNEVVTGGAGSGTFAGMTTAQLLDVRAVRLSLTARSARPLVDTLSLVPPSLEDHNRSAEPADTSPRAVEQTTVFLRNFGALDP